MNGEAVKELDARFAKPAQIEGFIVSPNGWQATDPAALVKPGPKAAALTVSTLGALKHYLVANRDTLDLSRLIVHVEGPAKVSVLGPLRERSRDREVYLTAAALDLSDGFIGVFMAVEQFIIGLQTRFTNSEERRHLQQIVGTIKQEDVSTSTDDGITQSVVASAGVVKVQAVPLPNPALLHPYRTFREVPQPTSPFLLRARGGAAGLPMLALFEADGGAWRLEATENVSSWLISNLPADVAVVA